MATEDLAMRPRKPPVSFDEDLPHHWLCGAPLPTHLVNSINLLFPSGERFFVRSVRHYADHVQDPELRRQMKAFYGQEGWHANAHEQFFDVLRRQGYNIDPFLRVYERIAFGMIERYSSPELRLSVTVALEHYTALMAEDALQGGILEGAHPKAKALLLWHAAEEIEHKSVAFDVLRAVNPSYGLRMRGFALATLTLSMFWVASIVMLLLQDWRQGRSLRLPPGYVRRTSILKDVFLRGIREYIGRDFHPSHNDNTHLARAYLTEAGIA